MAWCPRRRSWIALHSVVRVSATKLRLRRGRGLRGRRRFTRSSSLSELAEHLGAAERRAVAPVLVRIFLDVCAGLHAAHELRDDDEQPLGLGAAQMQHEALQHVSPTPQVTLGPHLSGSVPQTQRQVPSSYAKLPAIPPLVAALAIYRPLH